MHTDRGLDRLTTFVDAVVAIAITLLVLPLVDLLSGSAGNDDLVGVLAGSRAEFGAFGLSFAVIARLWWAHHRLVERVGSYDGAFVLVNMVWLLTIVLLPFASQVVSGYSGRLAVATYIGTVTASSACLTVLTLLVWRRRPLRREGAEDHISPAAAVVTTGLLLVALVLGVAIPPVNYFALLLLFLSGPIERAVRSRTRAAPDASG